MAGLLAAYGYRTYLGGSQQTPLSPTCHTKEEENCSSVDSCDSLCHCKEVSNLSNSDVQAKSGADLWLLNSCTVKGPAEDHFRNAIITAKKLKKRVVVAGCVPQGKPDSEYLKVLTVYLPNFINPLI
ncbi:unnamed protein product [Protopolystoma xenopodis]|uniref:MTTase N-terminal domain-containing protein n=1 Tax=Protopolystoma xenopodis TaxID=117903 RepID=A0A3S5B021_9PLAT|nr:unnamed protein product [Protopolystoma xenopodis]